MTRRFRFVSWTYIAVAVVVPLPLFAIAALAMVELPVLSALLFVVPTLIAVAMTRRAFVSLELTGDEVRVRQGVFPRRCHALPRALEGDVDPYRDREPRRGAMVRVETADHTEFEQRTRAGRMLALLTAILRLPLRVLGMASFVNVGRPVEVDEAMTELAFRDRDGVVRRIVVPAQGRRNEDTLVRLQAALAEAGVQSTETG